jgi:quinol monooxygenase YgiN
MKIYLAEILPGSRKYDGCKGLNVYFNTEDKNKLILVEHGDFRQQHEKYLDWRTET